MLTGAEVKSIKKGGLSLKGAFVGFENGELWLKNMHVYPYQRANQKGYEPERTRKILLKKSEIIQIQKKLNEKGLTLIPQKVYSRSGLVKLTVALAKGLKKVDKRDKIKKRDLDRQEARLLRNKY